MIGERLLLQLQEPQLTKLKNPSPRFVQITTVRVSYGKIFSLIVWKEKVDFNILNLCDTKERKELLANRRIGDAVFLRKWEGRAEIRRAGHITGKKNGSYKSSQLATVQCYKHGYHNAERNYSSKTDTNLCLDFIGWQWASPGFSRII